MLSKSVCSRHRNESVEAVDKDVMGDCRDRRLVVFLSEQTAGLSWAPPTGCEGEAGRAVLVGDPL